MTWQSPALVWARSIADRHTTRTVGVPRLDLVQVRPAAASQWHTTNVTRHDELRLAPRLAITVHTHLERAHTSAPRASSLVDRVYARADRVVPPAPASAHHVAMAGPFPTMAR